jgi:cytochrome bd-I ubiquinol oxidase subunit X
MWYFTWTLGLGLALAFGIINVLWLESSYAFGELDEADTRERFQSRSGHSRILPVKRRGRPSS